MRGHGRPLYLLPANGHAAADFEAIRSKLASDFETVSIDWPSMGESPATTSPHQVSAGRLAEMLQDVEEHLGRAPGVFIGHSVGAFAATKLALDKPSRVYGLILVDAGGLVPVRGPQKLFCWVKGTALATRYGEGVFARFHTKKRNDHVDAMLGRIEGSRHDRAYAATVGAIWRSFAAQEYDLSARTSAIRCPTLVVWGAHDPVVPLARVGRAVMSAIDNAESAVLPTGHSPFVEAPEEFLRAVRPFLQRIR